MWLLDENLLYRGFELLDVLFLVSRFYLQIYNIFAPNNVIEGKWKKYRRK